MRSLTVLTLASALLFSGCMGGSDGTSTSGSGDGAMTTGPATTGAATTGMGTTTGGAAMGNVTTLRCTTQAGASGNAQVTDNVGGCIMVGSTKGIVVAKAFHPATGCTPWFDTTPGDKKTEGQPVVDTEYPKGTAFGVYCDATMPPNSESTMDVTGEP